MVSVSSLSISDNCDFGDSFKRRSSLLNDCGTPGAAAEPPQPFFVLCAEDDKLSQMMLRKLLGNKGWDVVVAGNGKEAVDIWMKDGALRR